MYVCLCHGVSDKRFEKIGAGKGVTDITRHQKCTALGSQCGRVCTRSKEIIEESLIAYLNWR